MLAAPTLSWQSRGRAGPVGITPDAARRSHVFSSSSLRITQPRRPGKPHHMDFFTLSTDKGRADQQAKVRQAAAPARAAHWWCICAPAAMIADGATGMVEVGPGKVLQGLAQDRSGARSAVRTDRLTVYGKIPAFYPGIGHLSP